MTNGRGAAWLIATPGNVVDYERVRAELRAWAAESDVREVAYDPWNATDLVQRLQAQDGFTCVPMRQGFAALSAPTKALEKAVLSRALRHDGHPVLRAHIGNVAVETDARGESEAVEEAVDRSDRPGRGAGHGGRPAWTGTASTPPAPIYEVLCAGGAAMKPRKRSGRPPLDPDDPSVSVHRARAGEAVRRALQAGDGARGARCRNICGGWSPAAAISSPKKIL